MSKSLVTLEMGITPNIFDETLSNASVPYTIKRQDNRYELNYNSLSILIKIEARPPRIIAGLTLPVTQVELNFNGHSSNDVEQYMQRFKRYFHRGGG